ncbi:MAG TPA: CAP domain-containing protein [Kofleriaceae bacterium]|nr:CAP domain-containing protein [Kofleriaceae bacterium]
MSKLAVLAVLFAACGGDDGGTTGDGGNPGGSDVPHQTCITETNLYRQMNGKAAVAWSQALETYADAGAMDDFNTSPHHHFASTNGGGIAFAENECPQQGNWQVPAGGDVSQVVKDCIAAFYSEGPGGGHYDNMMGPYAKLGCGIYQSGTKITILQDFGN